MMYLLVLNLKTKESKTKILEYLEESLAIKITGDSWLIGDNLPLEVIGSHIEECMGKGDKYFMSEVGTITTNMENSEILKYNNRL